MHEESFGWKSLLLHLYNLKQEIVIIIFFWDRGTMEIDGICIPRLEGGGGGTLGISGWGCVAGTLEPLTYTRASSAEFCYPILE